MGQTIRQLLDFSRAELTRSLPIDLSAVVTDAVELVRYHSALRNLGIERQGVAPLALADPDRVRQVVVNLLINAGQALAGAGTIRVTVQTAAAGAEAEEGGPARVGIEVADDGPGVPENLVAQLFEPFFTTRAAGEGTGLGLAIAARIAGEAGGSIVYGSGLPNGQGGRGAAFTLWLPLAADGAAEQG
jgi:signal transduction histidine kinase